MRLNLFGRVNIASIVYGGNAMKTRSRKNEMHMIWRGGGSAKRRTETYFNNSLPLCLDFECHTVKISICQNPPFLLKLFCVGTSHDLSSTNLRKFVFQFLYPLLFCQAPDVFCISFHYLCAALLYGSLGQAKSPSHIVANQIAREPSSWLHVSLN